MGSLVGYNTSKLADFINLTAYRPFEVWTPPFRFGTVRLRAP